MNRNNPTVPIEFKSFELTGKEGCEFSIFTTKMAEAKFKPGKYNHKAILD